jgi:hypothetical protein
MFAAMTAACTTRGEPDRLVFGVSADRPAGGSTAEADVQLRGVLDAKLNQICTLGYDLVKVDTMAAEDNQQLVDEEVRCKPYTFGFSNLF